MNITNLGIIASIIASLVSVPFLSTSLTKNIDVGSTALDLSESQISVIPKKSSRTLSSKIFEKTFQTAFGEFRVNIESDKIKQELIEPNRRILATETPYKAIWTIYTQNWTLNVSRTAEKKVNTFNSPEGRLKVVTEKGGLKEYFEGADEWLIKERYKKAKEILQREIEKIERAKMQIELPVEPGPETVVINEFLPSPFGSDETGEWIELYNPTKWPINITGWSLKDEPGKSYTISEETIMGPKEFMVFTRNETGIALNPPETIMLLNLSEGKIDQYYYEKAIEGHSIGRYPDGADYWQDFGTPTPREPNS